MKDKTFFLINLLFLALTFHSQTILSPGTAVLQTHKHGNYEDSLMLVDDYTLSNPQTCRLDLETQWTKSINPEIWMEQNQYRWIYDESNHLSRYDILKYDHGVGHWYWNQRYYYTYTGDLLTRIEWYTANSYSGQDRHFNVYSYDNEHRLIQVEYTIYFSHIGYFKHRTKTKYYYDLNGHNYLDSIFYYDNNYYPISINQRFYDNNHRVDSLITNQLNLTQNNFSLTTYEYDNTGLLATSTSFNWNETWVPTSQVTYEYDVDHIRKMFAYNSTWNATDNTWTPNSRIKYGEFCTDPIEAEILPAVPLYRLYPNPGRELHLLPLSDVRKPSTIMVRDIRGIIIFEDQFQWPHLEHIELKSQSIPSGFYFVTIFQENTRQDIKWVKVD